VSYGQGFLFSKAVPADTFRLWVNAQAKPVGAIDE
jgi:sensor c-di-GMP phosphodiesterase-like protein